MATISNTNVGPAGQVISSTTVNAKFTDVATATATLDVNNVRSEGVDRRTLAASRTEPLAHMSYTNVTGTQAYTSNTGEAPFSITHGGGSGLLLTPNFTLKAGDLLRINFTIRSSNKNFNSGKVNLCCGCIHQYSVQYSIISSRKISGNCPSNSNSSLNRCFNITKFLVNTTQ